MKTNKTVCVLLAIFLIVNIGIAKEFGGINRAEYNPPDGTHISEDLSEYYHMTVATGDVITNDYPSVYWYVGGFWFTRAEMQGLPSESIMYHVSPYAVTKDSGSMSVSGSPTITLIGAPTGTLS